LNHYTVMSVYNILQNLKNIPGWKSSRKMIIIECDDWGGINMPSTVVYERLLAAGLKVGNRMWNRFDTLETAEDLEQLFTVLDSVRDASNKPAVFTPVTNVANPDFERIRSEGFVNYYYEKFTDTLNRYYPGKNVFKLWKEGLQAGIFMPELHGREHLAVQLWMEELRQGNKDLRIAFDSGFLSLDIPHLLPPARGFRAEFFFTREEQRPFLVNSIIEGVGLFEEIFGYTPAVFVPANGIFHPDFTSTIAASGVKFLWVNHFLRYPQEGGKLKTKWVITGQRGPGGLTYYTRNCSFEPNSEHYRGVDFTVNQIEAAFRWGKPAIVSTHRASYAGGLDPKNRTRGLTELKKLLIRILKKWPDIEFMSSGDALGFLRSVN